MEQYNSQDETRQIIISDMVKKRNSIVPVIGEDTIVYKDGRTGEEIPFQEYILNEFQKKYPRVTVDDVALTSMKERGYYGLSLLSQYFNEQGRFLDDFMDFVSKNVSCIKLKDEVLDFLVTFNFPIIITTVCFDIIEQQLKGKIEGYKSIWYRLNKENSTLPSRCFYHIFGQAKDGSKWVSDEDLLLTFLLSCAVFYYLTWFILSYCFFDLDGISLSNSRFIFLIYFFLPSIPIFLFSVVNGPKSFWLSHSYMNPHSLRIRFLKNAIIGCITISLLFGLGWNSKIQMIKQEEERKELLSSLGVNEVEMQKRMETRCLKEHIDSIFNDVMASAILTGYISVEEFQSNNIVSISYKYQQTIRDSLGTQEYYPSIRDSLKPDRWYSIIAWIVIKENYHNSDK